MCALTRTWNDLIVDEDVIHHASIVVLHREHFMCSIFFKQERLDKQLGTSKQPLWTKTDTSRSASYTQDRYVHFHLHFFKPSMYMVLLMYNLFNLTQFSFYKKNVQFEK